MRSEKKKNQNLIIKFGRFSFSFKVFYGRDEVLLNTVHSKQ